jgi:hypothetical protein
MRVLFIIRSPQIFHYYESIYDSLLKYGHNVELLFDKDWGENEYVADVKFNFEWAVSSQKSFRRRILLFFREVLSWRRYLLIKNQSSFYADRWLKYVSPKFRFLVKTFPFAKIFIKTKLAGDFLKNFEENITPDDKIVEDIKKRAPDVVIAGPVCYRQSSSDLEYLKAAVLLKIPTVVPVMTWDTLTTKGVFHVIPDLLLVWNEAQIVEACEHHGISKEQTRIVGAPFFDKWFLPRGPQAFRGTDTSDYILYLGSSSNIAPDERWLIMEIRKALDSSLDNKIKNTKIIFRPHPANFKIYQDFELPGVSVSPKGGEMPKTKDALQDFYNMLHYSSMVISINTSAMVDAILAGKPVISLEREEFSKTQVLAQHYKHMRESDALYITKTSEEFLEIFSKLLVGEDPKKIEREKFIKNFIRPRGLEKSVGEMVVYEIESLVKNYAKK